MAETRFTTMRGTFQLRRPHTPDASPLRAWSAADQIALDELGGEELGRILIVNDEFGALTVGLGTGVIVSWNDSALSRLAAYDNLVANGLSPLDADQIVPGHEQPQGIFDTVVLRLPKAHALLEHQLEHIRSCCHPTTRVIGCGMARHIHRSTIDLFERFIGPTTTSRATRKARLIFSDPQRLAAVPTLPQQTAQTPNAAQTFVTEDGVQVAELPGTFSAGHLDEGSALLLTVLAEVDTSAPAHVGDLGCGNGVLSASAARLWPEAQFVLVDVSDLAVEAARATWKLNGLDSDRARFVAADGFGHAPAGSLDMIITNPPFHQGHALDAAMTDRLLADSGRVLAQDGTLFVVAQRHLKLHTRLRRRFRDVTVLSQHPRFVVLRAAGQR